MNIVSSNVRANQMFCSLCIVILAAAACSGSTRMMYGSDGDIKDFPYLANVRELGEFSSGAVIINRQWVLSHALCRYEDDFTKFTVQVGSSNSSVNATTGTVHKVTECVYHPLYDLFRGFDYALLKVYPPLKFNEFVAPVGLPEHNQKTPDDAEGVVAGWGYVGGGTSDVNPTDQLQYGNITLIGDERCKSYLYNKYNMQTLCTQASDRRTSLCWFDEGDPLVVNGTLYGIFVWQGRVCADAQLYQLFGKVSMVRSWIDETIFG